MTEDLVLLITVLCWSLSWQLLLQAGIGITVGVLALAHQ